MGEKDYENLSFFELMELFKKTTHKKEKDFLISLANKSLQRDFEKIIKDNQDVKFDI